MNRRLRLGLALVCLIAVLVVAGLASARVGGGDSYGGGGGGGGDGGGGELVVYALYWVIRNPYVGVPLLIVVIGFLYARKKLGERGRQEQAVREAHALRSGQAASRRAALQRQRARLLADDPNFSGILFLDFAQMVYTRFQESRGSRQLEGIRPYLSGELFGRLAELAKRHSPGEFQVGHVVVGSIVVEEIREIGEAFEIVCGIESNYTEQVRAEKDQVSQEAWFARSRAGFRRAKGVLSQGPDRMRTLGCPGCGSPIKHDQTGACAYCGQVVKPGLFHWEMSTLDELDRRPRVQLSLETGGTEVGTDFPTVLDPGLQAAHKEFQMRYPGEVLQRLVDRAKDVFLKLQEAWTSGQWEQARAFETDRLFQMHLFWMDRYRDKGWRNVLEQVQVRRIDIVKIDRDAFLEAVTMRIQASMLDFTVDAQGKQVGGNRTVPRVFSEYWTFIRKAGFDPDRATDTASCPSCGAPVKVSMHGRCEYCDANLSSGDFDWTLATIEQDEAYVG